jgi:hypothetical protein
VLQKETETGRKQWPTYLLLYSYIIKIDKSKWLMNKPEIRDKNNYNYQSLKVFFFIIGGVGLSP